MLRSRKFAAVAATSLLAVFGASSGALAQCTDNFPNVALIGPGGILPATRAFPLGGSGAPGALSASLNAINTAFLTTTSSFVTGGSGAWVRGVGGESTVKTNSVGTIVGGPGAAGLDFSGSSSCNNKVSLTYSGFQIGIDISQSNVMGGRFNWGVMGGGLQSTAKDQTPTGTASTFGGTVPVPAGDLSVDQGTRFAGLYATYTQGSLFLDGQVRWDWHRSSGAEPTFASPFQFSGQGFAVIANAGYNIPLQGGWFIEPSGGVSWSNTSIDSFFVNRGGSIAGSNFGAGTVSFNDITSITGRATLRVGTTIRDGKVTWQPYFSYSLFHEFNGDITSKSVLQNGAGGTCDTAIFNGDCSVLTTTSKGGVGTFNQFALGVAGVLTPTTTVYARGDYKVGDNLEGWGISTGLRVNF